MNRIRIVFATTVLMCWSFSSAQGGAAIITLSVPPTGDGYSSLQTGSAIPTGVASAWYNPALLANLGSVTGSAISILSSREDWWFRGGSLEHQGVAVIVPAFGNDMGVAMYRTSFDLGEFYPDTITAGESVSGLAFGSNLNEYLDAGFAIKYYHSDLGVATASGWTFDLGLASSNLYRPFDGLQSLAITPSVATVLQNVGPDVW